MSARADDVSEWVYRMCLKHFVQSVRKTPGRISDVIDTVRGLDPELARDVEDMLSVVESSPTVPP